MSDYNYDDVNAAYKKATMSSEEMKSVMTEYVSSKVILDKKMQKMKLIKIDIEKNYKLKSKNADILKLRKTQKELSLIITNYMLSNNITTLIDTKTNEVFVSKATIRKNLLANEISTIIESQLTEDQKDIINHHIDDELTIPMMKLNSFSNGTLL